MYAASCFVVCAIVCQPSWFCVKNYEPCHAFSILVLRHTHLMQFWNIAVVFLFGFSTGHKSSRLSGRFCREPMAPASAAQDLSASLVAGWFMSRLSVWIRLRCWDCVWRWAGHWSQMIQDLVWSLQEHWPWKCSTISIRILSVDIECSMHTCIRIYNL